MDGALFNVCVIGCGIIGADLDEMLETDRPAIVVLATPDEFHVEPALAVALQDNDPSTVVRSLHALGIPHDLEHLGLDRETLKACVAALPAYCRAESLSYSVANEIEGRPLDDLVDMICDTYLTPRSADDAVRS